ncbi:MAG: TIGR02646 family protein, partial [Epsilonproteobacteria bacterium]|nr:TIGR02646 family protein [Campylobacterota bacterium]
MIKVEKDFANIPIVLTQSLRKEAFINNISSASYCDDKNRYKVGSVQKRLKAIYHLKCAYCEQKLLDAPKHIEHYRPKDIYYWLAYSWDNLLLCCGGCNSSKGINFATENNQVVYNNESFENIHTLGSSYDEIEKPKIINPEKEDVLELIIFDKDGKIDSENARVRHTIEEACNLNRGELVELRKQIITDFINRINKHYLHFLQDKNLNVFLPDIENFIE